MSIETQRIKQLQKQVKQVIDKKSPKIVQNPLRDSLTGQYSVRDSSDGKLYVSSLANTRLLNVVTNYDEISGTVNQKSVAIDYSQKIW